MRRVALTLRADAVEEVLDVLMPLLPQGVYERVLDGERTEVAFFGDAPPAGAELDAIAGDALLGARRGGGAGLARGAAAPRGPGVDRGRAAAGPLARGSAVPPPVRSRS